MQQLLNVGEVATSDGDGTTQLTSSFVILLGNSLDGVAKVNLELSLEIFVGVLRGTRADHEKEAGPLDAEGSIIGSCIPPFLVLFQEDWRVDDVIVVVGIVQKILDEDVWLLS